MLKVKEKAFSNRMSPAISILINLINNDTSIIRYGFSDLKYVKILF